MTPTQAVRSELASMFAPRSIALVGVSERSLWSTLILDGLGLMGFDGRARRNTSAFDSMPSE